MKTTLIIAAAFSIGAVGFGDAAWAQIPQYSPGPQTGGGGPTLRRSTRPVVSPYASLLGAGVGANGASGYQFFTRVQPQVAASRAIGTLGRSVNRLQAQSLAAGGLTSLTPEQNLLLQQQSGASGIGPTGHSVGYMNHTLYFGTNNQRGGGGTGVGGSSPSSTSSNPSTPVRR